MKNIGVILPLTLILLISFGCQKKRIVEIVPVMEIVKDMSIADSVDIRHLSFPSAQLGFAASDEGYVYRTDNGGTSWMKIAVAPGMKCNALEFFDIQDGRCLMDDRVYITNDGGLSWSYQEDASFIGITKEGIAVKGLCGIFDCDVFTSTNKGQSYTMAGTIYKSGKYRTAVVDGNNLIVFSDDVPYDGIAYGMDLTTGEEIAYKIGGLPFGHLPTDAYFSGSKDIIVGPSGRIMEGNSSYGFSGLYNGHTYTFYSVDGFGELIIAVGQRTIASNIDIGNDQPWNEMFDIEGNGFEHTFYKVLMISEKEFYLAGSGGAIYKAIL